MLLLGASGGEPTFQAWEAQLRREGVPYKDAREAEGTPSLRAEAASQNGEGGIEEARYQAVIAAVGNLPVCDEEGLPLGAVGRRVGRAGPNTSRTFHVRQITKYAYPEPGFGTNWPSSGGAFEGVAVSDSPRKAKESSPISEVPSR